MSRSPHIPVDAPPGASCASAGESTAADPHPAQQDVVQLATLLKSLDEDSSEIGRAEPAVRSLHENRLVQVRLGIASGLFSALRVKHPPTAAHSLRVALGCSCFAIEMGLPDELCDTIEMASLLHDIGKIGVPDHLLQKPGRLSADEANVMGHHVAAGLDILASCCASADVLDAIQYAPAWYDGSRAGFDRKETDLPVAARILTIVDAFDAMTTDRVYRPARSRERALAELFQFAGSQFDPELVRKYAAWHAENRAAADRRVARRWLQTLAEDHSNLPWQLSAHARPARQLPTRDALFEQALVNGAYDAIVFVDSQRQIFRWNQSAERLTGIPASAVCQRRWSPSLLKLRDDDHKMMTDQECPVAHAIRTGIPFHRRMTIAGRQGRQTPARIHVIPIIDPDGTTHGATLVLHDMSPEASLEERCASLRDLASKDPLTGVANRAEFDRLLDLFVDAHFQNRLPCALILCDIDHFKNVNDQHGHQAGDEVIKIVAGVLANRCQPGDVVARYGGEEFVLLCADCTNAAAATRAEHVRREVADASLPALGTGQVTASFGVTELQPGDTPETLFRRADRALLQAKEMGRNLVVQLGAGMRSEERRGRRWRWPWWSGRAKPCRLIETQLVTCVPVELAVEKLRGFVADHDAKVTSVGTDQVCLTIEGNQAPHMPRHGDRSVPFLIEIKFNAGQSDEDHAGGRRATATVKTRLSVIIRPKRDRDRRQEQAAQRARQVLASLKSYLMATE